MKSKVLIIVPCHNEAASIRSVINELRRDPSDFQILIIDDGSMDTTSAIARSLGVLVARLPINLGIGGAVQAGYRFAKENAFDVAVQFDGDGQHPANAIKRLIEPILSGGADLVIGSRYCNKRMDGNVSSLGRVFGSALLSYIIRLLTGAIITDPTSGFRASGRRLIELFAENYPYDYPEPVSVLDALVKKYTVKEIEVNMSPRLYGVSSISKIYSIFYMFKVTVTMFLKRIYG